SRSLLHDLALPGFERLLGGRIDPPGLEADRVFGRDGRAPELVPIRNPKRRNVVMRDQVIPVLQHPVERARPNNEANSVASTDQLLDQRVDHLVPDAEHIAASRLVGRLRAPILALLLTRRLLLSEPD